MFLFDYVCSTISGQITTASTNGFLWAMANSRMQVVSTKNAKDRIASKAIDALPHTFQNGKTAQQRDLIIALRRNIDGIFGTRL